MTRMVANGESRRPYRASTIASITSVTRFGRSAGLLGPPSPVTAFDYRPALPVPVLVLCARPCRGGFFVCGPKSQPSDHEQAPDNLCSSTTIPEMAVPAAKPAFRIVSVETLGPKLALPPNLDPATADRCLIVMSDMLPLSLRPRAEP